MVRLLIPLILIGVVIVLIKGGLRRASAGRVAGKKTTAVEKAEAMVACDYCGLHVPEGEAIKRGRHAYCSREHSQSGSAGNRPE